MSVKHPPRMLIDRFQLVGLVSKQHDQMGGPLSETAVTSVIDDQSIQSFDLAEIDLPPRVGFVLSVEAPQPIDDSIATARGIGLRGDHRGRSHPTQSRLLEPVCLDLSCRNRGREVWIRRLRRESRPRDARG